MYSFQIQVFIWALALSLVTPVAAQEICRRVTEVVARHDMTPFREYAHPLVVATDPEGRFAVSARPHIDDTVKVTPLALNPSTPFVRSIGPVREAASPEPELVDRGVRGAPVSSLTVSPADAQGRRRIAVADDEGNVDVFDAATGKYLHSTKTHPWPVTQMQYFPTASGLMLATAGGQTGRIWDPTGQTWRALWTTPDGYPHRGTITGMGVLQGNGPLLLTGSADASAKVWRLGDQDASLVAPPAHVIAHPGPVQAVKAAPNGDIFATGDTTGGVTVWQGKTPLTQKQTGAPVKALEFSRDGERILIVGDDGSAGVGTTRHPGINVDIPTKPYGNVMGGYLIRNGLYALTFHESGKVVVWDVRSPNPARRNAVPFLEYEGEAPVDGLTIMARRHPGENTRFLTTDQRGNVSLGVIGPITPPPLRDR